MTIILNKITPTVLLLLLLLLLLGSTHTAFAQVKIGEHIEEVSPFALLELESTHQGVLLPRMTSAQRDAAFDQAAPVGIMIFNRDANAIQYFIEEIDPTTKKRTGHKVWENASDETPQTAATLPTTGQLGQLFFNTQDNTLYYYTPTGWQAMANTTTHGSLPEDVVFLGDTLTYTSNGVTMTLDLAQLGSSTLSLNGTELGISNGNTVDLAAAIDARIAASGNSSNSHSQVVTVTGPRGPAGPVGPAGAAATSTSPTLFFGGSATSTATSLEIEKGNRVNLQASGTLAFLQTATHTLQLIGNGVSRTGSVTLEGPVHISGDIHVAGNTHVAGPLIDSTGKVGNAGEFLSSTGTQTLWKSIGEESIKAITSNYTASLDDTTLVVLPATAVTITLPTLSGADNGKKLIIKRGNAFLGPDDTLEIVPASGTIDGATRLRLNLGYQGYTLQALDSQWYITQRF